MANDLTLVKFARIGGPYIGPIFNDQVGSWWDLDFVTEAWHGGFGITLETGVKTWAPVKGTHAISQGTGTKQPAYVSPFLVFDNIDDFMQTANYTFDQPAELFWCGKFSYVDSTNDALVGGKQANVSIYNPMSATDLALYAGSTAAQAAGPAADTLHVFSCGWAGASSYWQIDLGTPTTGNPGVSNLGGITIGAAFDGSSPSPLSICGLASNSSGTFLTAAQKTQLVTAMMAYYGVA